MTEVSRQGRSTAGVILAKAAALAVGAAAVVGYAVVRLRGEEGPVGFTHGRVGFDFPGGGAIEVPLALLAVAVSALLVGLVFLSRSGRQVATRLWHERAWWFVGAVAVLALSLLPVHYEGLRFVAFNYWILVTLLFGSVAFALTGWAGYSLLRRVGALLTRAWSRVEMLPQAWFLTVIGGFTLVTASVYSLLVFEGIPHISDAIAQLFHARILASGRLLLASPPYPEFFDFQNVIVDSGWYSQYPFGHTLLLAFGVLARAPWLINPIEGALTVIVVYFLARRLYGERVGRIAGVLALTAPFLLFMSASHMNHSTTALFGVLFLLFYVRLPDRGWGNAVLCGLSFGVVVATRPATAVGLAIPVIVHAVVRVVRSPRVTGRMALVLLGAAVPFGLLLVFNWQTTGSPLLFAYAVKHGPDHTIGFGREIWGMVHTPGRGLVHFVNNLAGLNISLFRWPFPALALPLLLFAVGRRRGWEWVLLATPFSLAGVHLFYFWQSFSHSGPRLVFESVPALVILTALALDRLPSRLGRVGGYPEGDTRAGLAGLVLVAYLFAAALGVPPLVRYHSREYAGTSSRTLKLVRRMGLSNALVFSDNYANTFLGNRLDLTGPEVFVQDLGVLNPLLASAMPDRVPYVARRGTVAPDPGLTTAAGPLLSDLREALRFVSGFEVESYRAVIVPIRLDQLGAELEDLPAGKVVTYFERHRRLVRRQAVQNDFLPALCVWIVGDERRYYSNEHFKHMSTGGGFVIGGMRFSRLHVSEHRLVLVYDIRSRSSIETVR